MDPQTIASLRDLAVTYLSLLACLILLLPLVAMGLGIMALRRVDRFFRLRLSRVGENVRGVERIIKNFSYGLVGGVAGAKAILSGLAEAIREFWER